MSHFETLDSHIHFTWFKPSTILVTKGTVLVLDWNNWDKEANRAVLHSLSIAGKNMNGAVTSFGTLRGSATFQVANFPNAGASTYFSLNLREPNYRVNNGDAQVLTCAQETISSDRPVKKDNAF